MELDLYAKVEKLIGFDETYDALHNYYSEYLIENRVKRVLDVGCGSGNLLLKLKDANIDAVGVDLSATMVEIAKAKGLSVYQKDISQIDEKFDAIVAVADVLNYLTKDELKEFFKHIEKNLNTNGVFLADINTKHGFKDVTNGTMVKDFEDKFLAIDANFENSILTTDITLFTNNKKCYKKESARILQYFHKVKEIEAITNLKLIENTPLMLFSERADKKFLLFKL